jgi:N-acetylmuramoyl-L-alanine amidase
MRGGAAKSLGVGLGRLLAVCAALMCLGAAPWGASAASVVKVRFGGDQSQTRMVIELNRSTEGRRLDEPSALRLGMEFKDLDVPAGIGGAGQGLVRSWSIDADGGAARLVVSLTRPVTVVRRFLLAPTEGMPSYRYVIDLAANGPPAAAPANAATVPSPTLTPVADLPIHTRKVIVIDPGHGGKDPGAMGQGVHEKDLTLAAARALKRRLERDGRYVVVMTRSSDVFVPLEERVEIARRADADLFISLHADAGSDPSVRGATVYTLSDKGSDKVARKVFANNDWFINVSMPSHDTAVNRILLDLTQRATKNQSTAFADMLVDDVSQQTPMLEHSHRDAGYVVLLAPDVPAVLLEMGFVTNAEDVAGLTDPLQRARLMGAVGDAIDAYFDQQRRYAAR